MTRDSLLARVPPENKQSRCDLFDERSTEIIHAGELEPDGRPKTAVAAAMQRWGFVLLASVLSVVSTSHLFFAASGYAVPVWE